jgi:hypothetical protein
MAMADAAYLSAPDTHSTRVLRTLRTALLAGVMLNLGLIGFQVVLYPPLLSQSGSIGYISEPIVLLLVYSAIIIAATSRVASAAQPARLATLALATVFGLLTGGIWVVNHTLETFTDLSSLGLAATAPLLLGAFVLWGLAGFLRSAQTGSLRCGLLAALWSAMLCVLLTVTYGFLLLYFALPRLIALEASDPDFLRSHWSDLHAFAIANTFDAAFSHLVGALVVSLVFGAAGSLIGLIAYRRRGAEAPH